MPKIIRYRKQSDAYTTYILRTPEPQDDASRITELATLEDGYTYCTIPDGTSLPEQPEQIAGSVTEVTLDPVLREQIKTASPHCQLISQRMVEKIRALYTIDDEMYFARIGVGAANGLYQPSSDEMQAMTVFGEFVESVRQWGRNERAKLGL